MLSPERYLYENSKSHTEDEGLKHFTSALAEYSSAMLGIASTVIHTVSQKHNGFQVKTPSSIPEEFQLYRSLLQLPPDNLKAARRKLYEQTGYLPPITGGGRNSIDLPIDEIVKLHAEGKSPTEIALQFGVSVPTIHRRLHDAGVTLEWGGYRWSTADRVDYAGKPKLDLPLEEIRRLYQEEKMTAVAIANLYNCFERTIRSRLSKMGVQLRRGRPVLHKIADDCF